MLSVSHHRLIYALGIVLSLHLCLLMVPIVFETSKPSKKSPTLKLTLVPSVNPPPMPSKMEPDTNVIEPSEEIATEVVNNVIDKPPSSDQREAEPNSTNEPTQPPAFDRGRIITSVVNNIRENAAQPIPRGFSLEQWLPKSTPNYQRASEAPVLMAANAVNVSGTNGAGQSTDLVRGPNGKVACWQERGIPGETQQWYRVPIALCGHLNKP